ncbi:MAG: hypothetical protein K2M82_07355 [Lachnospiraceae bacterium]|nr:hypothetical protein [Lachnospiraceae bacterium]
MEEYVDFIHRISYQQAELRIAEGDFTPDGRVYLKVNSDNSFKPFYGDTVVFDLNARDKAKISTLIDKLYDSCSECFCNRLDTSTLHMTLHDLSASDNLDNISIEVFCNEIKLLSLLKLNPITTQKIKMKTNFVINMVNTSLVLALIPTDEGEWDKLQSLYTLIDEVKVCPYPYLTPHITLTYFNREGFDKNSSDKLKEKVAELNRQSFDITLCTKNLFYQKFISMNDYTNVFGLTSQRG